ncbi:MAG: rod shape-determining protein MreC [Collinsella sp.]|nr:rod shape-determining protein MreC [Collinsella sp.]
MQRSNKNRYTSALRPKRRSSGMRPFIVCLVVSLLLLTFYLREGEMGPIHAVRGAVTTITSPVRMAGSIVASPFHAIGNAFSNLTAPQETLSELREENERLTSEVARLTESQKTATRLEDLLDLKSTYNLNSSAARIIGGSSDAWSRTVTLDKGSADGFAVGMPVCNSGGVIGQIIEVAANTSTVRLLTDENSGIAAMVQSSRAQGVLQGQPDGTLLLSYVSSDADVSVGDIIITSGLGGTYPKGLPLGTVSSVNRAGNATYYTIVVRAQSLAENNEEVLVITSVSQEQMPTAEEVAAANSGTAAASGSNDAGNTDSDKTDDQKGDQEG